MNKKALTLGQLVPAVAILVTVVILLAVGLKLTTDMKSKVIADDTSSTTNETVSAAAQNATRYLANVDIIGITSIWNDTGDHLIASENITIVNARSGEFTITDYSCVDSVNVTYTWYTKTEMYKGINGSIDSLIEISGWGDLIGLVVAASIILGLVLGAIALRAGRA